MKRKISLTCLEYRIYALKYKYKMINIFVKWLNENSLKYKFEK